MQLHSKPGRSPIAFLGYRNKLLEGGSQAWIPPGDRRCGLCCFCGPLKLCVFSYHVPLSFCFVLGMSSLKCIQGVLKKEAITGRHPHVVRSSPRRLSYWYSHPPPVIRVEVIPALDSEPVRAALSHCWSFCFYGNVCLTLSPVYSRPSLCDLLDACVICLTAARLCDPSATP